jgi:O-antigen/teichoic acid export membrane protein
LQLRVRHIARNVVLNWLGTIANMAVGFFLSPFILHSLGEVAYSVWVLAVSVVGYLNLLDLGMQSSIIRFVSQGFTKGDHESASDAASAALWVRLQISGLAILLSAIIALVFPHVFKIPANLARDAQEAVLLIGASTAVTMTLGVAGAVVSALNRYDLQNYVGLGPTAIRVAGIVWSLRTGHGIVAIAMCEFIATLVNKLLQVWVAHRLYPELRYRLRKPQSETLRKVWSYSFYTFLVTVAVQLVYQTDNVVVGAFVSLGAVAFYSIANSLCRYTTQIISAMSGTFMPAASSYEAAGEARSLELLFKNGTRAMMMASLPVLITVIVRGSSFIGLWMGPQYAHSSGVVLAILAFPLIFAYANQTAAAIAFGVEKHKMMAFWAIGEGVANLVLSIVLAHWYGIYGVALGTLIPSLIAQFGFWPRYISKLVGVSAFGVIWGVWSPILLASVPFAVASWLVDICFPAHSMIGFMLQVIATLPVFLIPAIIIFRKFLRDRVLPTIKQMFAAAV